MCVSIDMDQVSVLTEIAFKHGIAEEQLWEKPAGRTRKDEPHQLARYHDQGCHDKAQVTENPGSIAIEDHCQVILKEGERENVGHGQDK